MKTSTGVLYYEPILVKAGYRYTHWYPTFEDSRFGLPVGTLRENLGYKYERFMFYLRRDTGVSHYELIFNHPMGARVSQVQLVFQVSQRGFG